MYSNNFDNITRKFNVTVLSIPIVYDFFGDYDQNGMMYILSEDKGKVKEKALKISTIKIKKEIHFQYLQKKFNLLQ